MSMPQSSQEIRALIQKNASQKQIEPDSFGSFLRELRQERRAVLAQVADQAGIARVTLNRWELGTHRPHLPELEAVLQALDATPQEREQALILIGARRGRRQLQKEASEQAEDVGGAGLYALGNQSGELLRALRHRQGLSQEQVSARLGLPRQTLSRWENGETTPPNERVGELLDILGARAEERAALTSAGSQAASCFSSLDSSNSLEAMHEALRNVVYSPAGHDPAQEALKDLSYLTLEARLTPLALRQVKARISLAETYAFHAQWLANNDRFREAAGYAEKGLELIRQEQLQNTEWQRAVIVAAQAAVYGGTRVRPQRGVALLDGALANPIASHFESWIVQDLAEYLGLQSRYESALLLSSQACVLAERRGDMLELRLRRLGHARLLLKAGRERDALAALSNDTGLYFTAPAPLLSEYLLRSEALLRSGDASEAHEWLGRAYTLAADYQLNTRQADALAHRF